MVIAVFHSIVRAYTFIYALIIIELRLCAKHCAKCFKHTGSCIEGNT